MMKKFAIVALVGLLTPLAKGEPEFDTLFDGTSLEGWEQSGNWEIQTDGSLFRKEKGGSLVFAEYKVPDDFELRFEWRVGEGSNSGVYYRPTQYEYQILHNEGHSNGTNPRTTAASLYFCMAPSEDVTKPVGEWNTARIVAKGSFIQHWLNGEKVVAFDYDDSRWEENVKLLQARGGDLSARGAFLSLQDHGDPVWFRNIRLREIPAEEEIDESSLTPALVPESEREAERKKVEAIRKKREAEERKTK
ncbi:MAG: glycosyl hydrolase [Verrucomicrobiales bacterium]|nr:glycosyl hydrolase [Verrucomicrobiales bacterium]